MEPTAYFSAEIGFSHEIPTYSGGLGVLAGDHLKAAADAGLPIVGLTLLYRQGYFRQHLSPEGWQHESYPPFTPDAYLECLPYRVVLPLASRPVHLAIWRTHLTGIHGYQVPILFLDADLPENNQEDRLITHQLYGGDQRTRLLQEAILGFGGVRAMQLIYPDRKRFHLNEGHTAFVPIALLQSGMSLAAVRSACHFTTHTPVPAGHDVFAYDMADAVLDQLLPTNIREFGGATALSMSELALRLCQSANGVSKLHGEVARAMFPDASIGYVTNGVHHLTWVGQPMAALFDQYLEGWRHEPTRLQRAVQQLPTDALIHAHALQKRALLSYANAECNRGLADGVLTLGFARRAAAYKRAHLLFHDLDRLQHMVARSPAGRLQIIFAGKAHPRDEAGHRIIQSVINAAEHLGERVTVTYLPNYNMWLGGLITAGVDVWLNTPLRPHEASGTSGMKAALNGVPSASISDGWWAEGAVDGQNGWVIGHEDQCDDATDAESLYTTLEQRIMPLFYQPDRTAWAEIMKHAIVTGTQFTASRMIQEYRQNYYGG